MRLILALFFLLISFSANATVYTAADCNISSINAQLAFTTDGDELDVPAGNCNWAGSINTITHGISLIGVGNPTITLTSPATNSCYSGYSCVIRYEPSNYAADYNFRISGFTFHLNNQGTTIWLGLGVASCSWHGKVQTNIRIDHINADGASLAGSRNGFIVYYPGIFGVVDHNTFNGGFNQFQAQCGGVSRWAWDNIPGFQYGSRNAMYFEDNDITVPEVMQDCQDACRYVYRYNKITITTGNTFPLIDSHGNSTPGNYSGGFGGEVYGNIIFDNGHSYRPLDQRGGKFLVFYNNSSGIAGAPTIQIREEFKDTDYPTNATNCTIFPTGTGGCDSVDSVPQQPQHVWMTYYWNNFYNANVSKWRWATPAPQNLDGANNQCGSPCDRSASVTIPQFGLDFFGDIDSGGSASTQVQSGSSLPGTCSNSSGIYVPDGNYTGPGYWLTTQSTTDLTGMTGQNPTTPISGTLYQCTATNTWTAYYTPLTYPHPLIGGTPPPPPPPQPDIYDYLIIGKIFKKEIKWQ